MGFFTLDHQEREKSIMLLKLISDASKHFTFEIVNPEINPGRTRKYGKILSGNVVVESGNHWEKINKPNETSILSAVLRITSEAKRIVYFSEGHGEKELDDIEDLGLLRVKNTLESLGFDVRPVNFLKMNGVPDDADVVVVPGPEKDFFIAELNTMNDYLETGGALLVLVDPNHLPNFEQFCRDLGITLGKGVIIDKSKRISGSDFLVTLIDQYGKHEITADIENVKQSLTGTQCQKCASSLVHISTVEDLVENLGEKAEEIGAKVEMISSQTEEGNILLNFGGIGAILRYKQHV